MLIATNSIHKNENFMIFLCCGPWTTTFFSFVFYFSAKPCWHFNPKLIWIVNKLIKEANNKLNREKKNEKKICENQRWMTFRLEFEALIMATLSIFWWRSNTKSCEYQHNTFQKYARSFDRTSFEPFGQISCWCKTNR